MLRVPPHTLSERAEEGGIMVEELLKDEIAR